MVGERLPPRLPIWIDWLDQLWDDVHGLVHSLLIFRGWNEIVAAADSHTTTPGNFHQWVNHNYVAYLAVTIRRLTDTRRDTVSLVRLLDDVARNTSDLSREWFLARAIPQDRPLAERQFRQLSTASGAHIAQRIPRGDRERLIADCDKIKSYVDTRLAHLRREQLPVEGLTFGDAHRAGASIYSMYRKWHEILTEHSLAPLLPEPWQQIFTIPWLNTAQATEIAERVRTTWIRDTQLPGMRLE